MLNRNRAQGDVLMQHLSPAIPGDPRLSRHVVLESQNVEEVHRTLTRDFSEHALSIIGPRRLHARLHRVALPRMSFNYLDFGAAVAIRPQPYRNFYLVVMPLRNSAITLVQGKVVPLVAGHTFVYSPAHPPVAECSADFEALFIKIDRRFLEDLVECTSAARVRRSLEFTLGEVMDREAEASWTRLVHTACADLDHAHSIWRNSPATAQLETLIGTTLLTTVPHTYSAAMGRSDARGSAADRVADYIWLNADQDITIQDLLDLAGTSRRSLFAQFHRHRGIGPMTYLRQVRLGHVRRELLSANPVRATVTEVAMKWGFTSLGHFARQYRALYGESPSQTLTRRINMTGVSD